MKFLSLRKKTVIIVSLVCIALFSLAYIYSSNDLKIGFEILEKKDAQTNISRVQAALKADGVNLISITSAWSGWDDAFAYIDNANVKFEKTNLGTGITTANVDLFSYWKINKKLVWGANIDLITEDETKKISPFSEIQQAEIQKFNFLFNPKNSLDSKTFYVQLKNGPYLIVSSPVTSTDSKKTPNGVAIVGIKINGKYFSQIGKRLGLKLENFELQNTDIPIEVQNRLASINSGNFIIEKKSDAELWTYDLIKTEDLKDLILYKLNLPRNIHLQSKKTMNVFLKTMVFSTIILVICMLLSIDRLVISRVNKLSTVIHEIKISQNLNQKLPNLGHDEIGELGSSFQEMLIHVEKLKSASAHNEKMASLGEMAGGIAHEINNPIAIISGSVDIIRKMFLKGIADQEKYIKQLDNIDKTIIRTSKIINGLKNISRDTSNEETSRCMLVDIISDSLAVCSEKFKVQGIQIKYNELDPVFKTEIDSYRVQLSQVIFNILNNSFDAIEKTTNPWVEISASVSDHKLTILLRDSGSGIPIEIQSKIFQPFYTTKEIGKGTGLGLSLCNSIIERHKGKIFIDNNQTNTCFVIILPIKEVKNVP